MEFSVPRGYLKNGISTVILKRLKNEAQHPQPLSLIYQCNTDNLCMETKGLQSNC